MSDFPFRMPKDLEAAITAQAERAGVSLDILARAGQGQPPEPGDALPPDLAP